jgi:hypothetical protein
MYIVIYLLGCIENILICKPRLYSSTRCSYTFHIKYQLLYAKASLRKLITFSYEFHVE